MQHIWKKKNQIKCMQHNINNVIEQQQHQQQKWWVLGNGRQTTICDRPPTHHKVMMMGVVPHQSTCNAIVIAASNVKER
jgi:hypothetical protein